MHVVVFANDSMIVGGGFTQLLTLANDGSGGVSLADARTGGCG